MTASPRKRRWERSAELVKTFPGAGGLLNFYGAISRFQESISEALLRIERPDLKLVALSLPPLCALIEEDNFVTLVGSVDDLLREGADKWEEMLRSRWEDRRVAPADDSVQDFLSRVLLQPYAEYLASRWDAPPAGEATCPFCAARPVVGVLRPEGEGAKRSLICSLCSTEWTYRRIVCPVCGETDRDKLPVYKAETICHVRLEACDSCHCYLKSVDLTVDGLAVPVVDELATVTLDVWAEKTGYVKIQKNVLGL